MTSLHDIAPRLAVARDSVQIEQAAKARIVRCFHQLGRCDCGGVGDVYRLTMEGQRVAPGTPKVLRGAVARCRRCGEGESTLTVDPIRAPVGAPLEGLRAHRLVKPERVRSQVGAELARLDAIARDAARQTRGA